MRTITTFTVMFFMIFILLSGCSNKNPSENNDAPVDLMISAAISLTDALNEIKTVYEADHNVSITFNLGSSGKLAQQITHGAPSDIYISANEDWMDRLEDKEMIDAESRTNLTGNSIVLITGEDMDMDIRSFSDIRPGELHQVAIGNPDSVPAGKYAKQALKNVNVWGPLQEHIILAKDVRQVLTYVETGNTDVGIVYASDARTSDKVKVVATADNTLHSPIVYPGAIVTDSNHKNAASQFLAFLTTDEAQAIFETYGFTD